MQIRVRRAQLRDGRALTFNVEGRGLVKMEAVNMNPIKLQGKQPFCIWDLKIQGFKKTEIYPGTGWKHRSNPICASKKQKDQPDGPYVLGSGGLPFPAYILAELHIEFRRTAEGPLERYSATVPFAEYSAKGERLNSPQFVIDEAAVRAVAWRFGRNGAYVEDVELPVTAERRGAE